MKFTSEVVASDVVGLGVLHKLPNLGLLQVLEVVVVGSAELGAHASVVSGDDNTAATSGLLGVDAVLDAETNLLDGIAQDGRVLVVTDSSNEYNAVRRQDVLGTARGVLCRSAGNQLGLVVAEQVLEDASMLGLRQDRIVGLEAILLQERLVAKGLDICIREQERSASFLSG